MDLFDPKHLIETFGTIGLILIVYAESGILIGLILPGDEYCMTSFSASPARLDVSNKNRTATVTISET